MANAFVGRAAVYGLNGVVSYEGLALTNGYWMPQGAEFTSDAELKQDLVNASTSAVVGKAWGRHSMTLSVDVIPTSDPDGPHTMANAKLALADTAIPCKVTLTSFDHADLNGAYLYDGGERTAFTPDGWVVRTLPLKKYEDLQSTADILTTPVA